ncbi:MAG: hypothetical protein JWM95_2451 [Gemmatimonadetes bacterium]|nr:hypothetical protein [Gemmatimonadota bacterium]
MNQPIFRWRHLLPAVAFTACSTSAVGDRSETKGADPLAAARIEIQQDGGIVGLSTRWVVDRDTHSYVYARRHICDRNCGAPLDSVGGMLTSTGADSLFQLVLAQNPLALQEEYGTTKNAADMMSYTLRLTAGGITKSTHADDGTMPPEMRQIIQIVRTGVPSH